MTSNSFITTVSYSICIVQVVVVFSFVSNASTTSELLGAIQCYAYKSFERPKKNYVCDQANKMHHSNANSRAAVATTTTTTAATILYSPFIKKHINLLGLFKCAINCVHFLTCTYFCTHNHAHMFMLGLQIRAMQCVLTITPICNNNHR